MSTWNALARGTFLIALCIIVRVAWLGMDFDSLRQDPDAYKAIAEGLAVSGTLGRIGESPDAVVYPTAYRPPAYAWMLSRLVVDSKFNEFYVSIFHVILGVLTCVIIARIAYLLSQSWLVLSIATLGVAIDPILLKQSSQVMTETLATLITVTLWWGWIELMIKKRSRWEILIGMFGLGLLAGIGCLVRPTTLAWITIWLVLSLGIDLFKKRLDRQLPVLKNDNHEYYGASISYKQYVVSWLVFVLGVSVVLTPWAYRNSIQIGKWIFTTTHGGYTLLLANNPVLYESIREHGWDRQWDESRFHLLWDQRRKEDPRDPWYWERSSEKVLESTMDDVNRFEFGNPGEHREISDDRLAAEVAWRTIRDNPATFLKSCLVRLSWFWSVSPYRSGVSSTTNNVIGLWYSLLFCGVILSISSLIRDYARAGNIVIPLVLFIPAVSLLISLNLVHAVYWSNMRMRAPAMPILYVVLALLLGNRAVTQSKSLK